jgi:hypothetical protein
MKMKTKFFSIIAVVLLLLVPAFAGTRNKAEFRLDQPAKVAGTQLAPGSYVVTWQGDGANAQFTFLKEGRVITTANGSIVNQRSSFSGPAVHLSTTPEGALLRRLELPKQALVFQEQPESASGK